MTKIGLLAIGWLEAIITDDGFYLIASEQKKNVLGLPKQEYTVFDSSNKIIDTFELNFFGLSFQDERPNTATPRGCRRVKYVYDRDGKAREA